MDTQAILAKLGRLLDRMVRQPVGERRSTWRDLEAALAALRHDGEVNQDGQILARLLEIEVAAEALAGRSATSSQGEDAARHADALRALDEVRARLSIQRV